MPNQFYTNKQFYFKQFSLAKVYSFIVKNISISINSVKSNSSNSKVQFNKKKRFVYTQLDVKTVQFPTIQFNVSTVSMSKTVLFQTHQFIIRTQFKYQNSSILNNSVYHKYAV